MTHAAHLAALTLGAFLMLPLLSGADAQDRQQDPHIVPRPRDLREDPQFVSAPELLSPIFACGTSVRVRSFVPQATLLVFDVTNPATPIGNALGLTQDPWQPVDVPALTAGQTLFAVQVTPDGVRSGPSNNVTVISHTEVYRDGLPQPVLLVPPPLACGAAIGVAPPIPSATVRIRAEAPTGPGTFAPPVEIGSLRDFPYAFVSPFVERHRITAQAEICTDKSPVSPEQFVAAAPGSLPPPLVADFTEKDDRLVVSGPAGPPPQAPFQGARLEVFRGLPGGPAVGGQPTPGLGPQQVLITPRAQPRPPDYTATQALCSVTSPPSDPVGAGPCEAMPAPTIRDPVPGDTSIEILTSEPGAEIVVYVNGGFQGRSGPPSIALRPGVVLKEGDNVVVIQRNPRDHSCAGGFAYEIDVGCGRGGAPRACSGDWPAYRQNPLRDGLQPANSPLSDPARARRFAMVRQFPPPGQPALAPGFRAGPVVFRNRVFIGSGDGHLYALDATTLAPLWQYPKPGDPALTSRYTCNPSSFGIAASAAIADLDGRPVVIFGAPDQSIGPGLGSGRLFALDLNGNEIWKSPEIARLTGTTPFDTNQLHEQIGYSAPLVAQGRVYVGIADHCDNPIQEGRAAAVSVFDGSIIGGFNFRSVSTRGGGVWSALAGNLEGGVFATTGNTNRHDGAPEPADNHGLSLVRLDPNTGALEWKLQPVPYEEDGDPDWSAGATLMRTRCGPLVASTMKDGWAYAANAAAPLVTRWQFPPTAFPFFAGDPYAHGDTRYHRSGAAWRDTFVAMMGGHEVTTNVLAGYRRLHALDACAGNGGRVRWLADIPGIGTVTDPRATTMSPPSLSGGVVYVGTHQGHLVVLADPSVWPTPGLICVRPELTIAQCQALGLQLVPRPALLADLALGQGEIIAEPALAQGRVYVATVGGRVLMLEPR